LARQEEALLVKLEPALQAIVGSTNADVATWGKGLLPVIQQERPNVTQMIGQFCK
jgi:hypothetical protein